MGAPSRRSAAQRESGLCAQCRPCNGFSAAPMERSMKQRRSTPTKREPREIDAKTNRARRREQIEQAERAKLRPRFQTPEQGEYRHEDF